MRPYQSDRSIASTISSWRVPSAQPDRNDVHLADEFHRRRLDREQFMPGIVDKAVPAARLRTTAGRLANDELVVETLVDRSDVLEIGPDDQVFSLHLVSTCTQRLLLREEIVLDRGVGLQFEGVIRLGDKVSDEAVAVESHVLIAEILQDPLRPGIRTEDFGTCLVRLGVRLAISGDKCLAILINELEHRLEGFRRSFADESIDVGVRAARLIDDLFLADADEGVLDLLLVHGAAEGRSAAFVAVDHYGGRPVGCGHLEIPVAQKHSERRNVISHVTLPL